MTQEQEDQIRQRAFEIWALNGCTDGQDLDHWLQAEREMIVPKPLETTELASADLPPAQNDKLPRRANGNRAAA